MIRNPFALGLLLASLTTSAAASRDRSSFNFDWRFTHGDPAGAEQPGFDATAWQAVDLPHDFAIHGPFDEKVPGGGPSGFRPLGLGWYRKEFVTPPGADGRRVWLEFEGVYRAPKVWVNGVLVAERLNGYVGFECDLTPHLRPPGERNLSDELFQSDRRSAWQGRAQLVVRSKRQPGRIVVRAVAAGLPAAELQLPVR